jgi:hypothetical protein
MMKNTIFINNKCAKYFVFVLFFIFAIGFNQINFALSINNNLEDKPDEIIKRARNKVSQNAKVIELEKLSLVFSSEAIFSSPKGETLKANVETSLYVSLPNSMRIENYSDYSINQQLFIQIFNTDKYSEESQMLVGGKPFNFQSNLESLRPKVTKEQQIEGFKRNVFTMLFPIFFKESLYEGVEFRYVGEAEVDGFSTDVIEAMSKDKPIFQLFFNKKDGLPIFMRETLINPFTKSELERKTYYSDYRENAGFLVAHKIISQRGETAIEEKQLKKLQINPTFKANTFEVKEK